MVERSGWFLGVKVGIDQASSEKRTLPTPPPRPDACPSVASAEDDPQGTLGNGVGMCVLCMYRFVFPDEALILQEGCSVISR